VPDLGTQEKPQKTSAMPISPGKSPKAHRGAAKPMFERVSALLVLLRTKGAAASREDLAKQLKRHGYQASVRTVQRDIDFLKQQGHDIIHSKNGGYSCKGAKDKLRGLLNSREEMLASIVVMRGVLNAISKLDPSAGADVLLSQAGELLEKNHLEYGELSNFISSAALSMPQRLVPIFRTLVKGLIEKRAVRISYTGNKDRQPRTRVIHPYHLLEFEGRWHCISHCTEAKEIRTFMLWRTHTAELLDEPFVRPAEFDDPKHWEEKAKIYGVWSGDGKPMNVKVKMFGYAARIIQEAERRHPGMTITESKTGDGTVEVTFQTHSFADVTSWILKWGPYCEVLGPPALVKEVRELIERMGKLYDAH